MLTPNQTWNKLKLIRKRADEEMLFDACIDVYNTLVYSDKMLERPSTELCAKLKRDIITREFVLRHAGKNNRDVLEEMIEKMVAMLKQEYDKDHKGDY